MGTVVLAMFGRVESVDSIHVRGQCLVAVYIVDQVWVRLPPLIASSKAKPTPCVWLLPLVGNSRHHEELGLCLQADAKQGVTNVSKGAMVNH